MPIVNMMLGEVAPGGTGSGPVRHPDPGGHHGLRGRADGRAHAGVPGQEDRRPGDEARLAVLPDHPALVLVGTGGRDGAHRRAARRCSTPARTACPRCSTRSPRPRNNNGSAFAGITVNTPFYNTALGLACCSAGSCRSCSSSAWPARWPSRSRCRRPRARCHPPAAVRRHARRRDADRRRPHLPPALALGPLAEGLPDYMTNARCSTTAGDQPTAGARSHAGSAAACSTPSSCSRPLPDALRKLNPRTLWRNPVMFIVEIGAVFTTVLAIARPDRVRLADHRLAVAHRASSPTSPRRSPRAGARPRPTRCAGPRHDTIARRLLDWQPGDRRAAAKSRSPAPELQQGDVVVVEAGEIIPGDGDVIEGIASVDESAITGESAPVIRESGGDRSAVTGGTKVLSDRIVVRITQKPGESFIDRMIALVEGANRQKTPNEIALNILLAALTIIFLLAVATLQPLAIFSKASTRRRAGHRRARRRRRHRHRAGVAAGLPDPDHDRRAAVGDRHRRHGPAGAAQRAGHVRPRGRGGRRRQHAAAGQDRHHHPGQPAGRPSSSPSPASTERRAGRRRPAVQPGRRDARGPLDRGVRQDRRTACASGRPGELAHATLVPFTAQTRMSGVDLDGATAAGRRSARARRGRGDEVGPRPRRPSAPTTSARSSTASPAPAAPRWSSPSTSTGSRPGARRHPPQGRRQGRACGSASTRCAGWASAP